MGQFLTRMVPDCVIIDYVTSNLLREILLLSSHSVKKQFPQREKRTRLSLTTTVCSSSPHYPSNHYRPSYFVPADGRTLKRHNWLQKLNISLYFACLNDNGQYIKNISPCCWQNSSILKLTRGSLFFTKRTIFTDSSSSSSSRSSGRGGSTGSKFFCATVSCTVSTAWWREKSQQKLTRWPNGAVEERMCSCMNEREN